MCCVLTPSIFTPSDKLYIKIMLKIGISGVNNPSKDMISSLTMGDKFQKHSFKEPNIQTQGHVSERSYFDILHF